jgi:hypothetical protein
MPSSRRLDAGAAGLAVLEAATEGGWLLVVYAGFEVGLVRHDAALGPIEFTLAALLGIWIARRPRSWPRPRALAALAAVVVVGWLADPAVLADLEAGAVPAALVAHPGALLLGAAVIRGGSHRDPLDDVDSSASLLRFVTPALIVPWLVGALIPLESNLRSEFVSVAWMGTLVFVVAGFAALGFGRLRLLGITADPRDPAGRTWFLVTAAVPLGIIALGVPLAIEFGLRPDDLAAAIARPGALLFSILGLLAAPPIVAGFLLASLLTPGGGAAASQGAAGGSRLAAGAADSGQTASTALLVAIIVGVAALVVLRWLRPPARDPDGRPAIVEERTLVMPARLPRLRLPRRSPPRLSPHDAVTAYLATLVSLADDPSLARGPSETPAGHARRLAEAGADPQPGLLRRLAADYQLARYAERRITTLENGRALARWRRHREARRTT